MRCRIGVPAGLVDRRARASNQRLSTAPPVIIGDLRGVVHGMILSTTVRFWRLGMLLDELG
jgi:hypothetical protein